MITDKLIKIRSIRENDIAPLKVETEADNHILYYPSHVVEKNNSYIGHFSLNTVPMVLLHMNTKKALVRDSLQTMNTFENILRMQGAPAMAVPCMQTSPFFPLMESVGFVNITNMSLFIKNL